VSGAASESSYFSNPSSETRSRRAWRLGAELNLATPAIQRKKIVGPAVPVPRAWSSLVLNEPLRPNIKAPQLDLNGDEVPAEESEVDSNQTVRLLEEVRRENEALIKSNQVLQRENAKLRTFLPSTRSPPGTSPRAQGSPFKNGEPKKTDNGFGIGHPESELIIQFETYDDETEDVARHKMISRQLFSMNTLVKSLNDTIHEDRLLMSDIMQEAFQTKRRLEEAQRKVKLLEAEVKKLQG
jgi:hypothetical protein